MTTDPKILNLNKARKERARSEDKARADANAAKHGRTKAQRLLEAAQADKARRTLDRARFEDENEA
jgi:phage protein D